MDGWIKLHRKMLETSFANKPFVGWLFVNLLLLACHKTHKIIWNKEELKIERGQILTGRKQLSEQTGISEQSIRTALTSLKSTNTITIKKYSKFSIISIKNYSLYQTSTSKSTNNQPATNQQVTTYKKEEKENIEKKREKTNTIFLTKNQKILLRAKFPTLDIDVELEKANDFLKAEGLVKQDYLAWFRSWLRRGEGFQKEKEPEKADCYFYKGKRFETEEELDNFLIMKGVL